MKSYSAYRPKKGFIYFLRMLVITCACTLEHPNAAQKWDNVVEISIRNLNIPTQ